MKYNGKELEELNAEDWVGMSRRMFVWNVGMGIPKVAVIIGFHDNYWITPNGTRWDYCAEILEEDNQVLIIDEMIKILNAYKEGKKIECRYKDRSMSDSWSYIDVPAWNWEMYEYRVKQEPRRMTYKEVNDWLAKGNGRYKITGDAPLLNHDVNETVDSNLVIRAWHENDWHEPLIEE